MEFLFLRTNKLAVPFNRYKHPNLNCPCLQKKKKETYVRQIEYQKFIPLQVLVEIDLREYVKGFIVFPNVLFIIICIYVLKEI